ncbi:hypothetical protein DENIS_1145 [Desulfonema ishimotonii]|uniref:General secretion pathway protein GspM n=1 Tax=Desulfonema ishimotonii TaxID=45657 RepID=A0A401FTB4_9BACT|nr:type II secretion system protein GspM [Desulfonema ishimotonii]GBC60194.1 hypothetical protein DENIS_1145 [Desulfonema ishimotonii]
MTKERKYILIIGAVLLVIGAMYRFSGEIGNLFAGGDETLVRQKQVLKYRKVVREKGLLQERFNVLNRTLSRSESGLLTGGTSALAAVDIQNILNDIAGRSQAEIRTMRVMRPVEPEEGGVYIAVPVQVALDVTIRQLEDILYRIENSPRLLKISNIRIRLPNTRNPEKIQVTFTVEGFMKDKNTAEI